MTGTIMKALSGFYYVDCESILYTCRARGKFRHKGENPLVGDRVEITDLGGGTGSVGSPFWSVKMPSAARRWPIWISWL